MGSPTVNVDIMSANASTSSSWRLWADQDAGLRDAGLAVVHQACHLQSGHRFADIGIVKNDRRRLAAELQAYPLQLLAAEGGDPAAGDAGTGERDLVHAGMAHQCLAHIRAAGDHRYDPFGKVDLLDHLGQPQSVQRSFGRRLDDHGAARKEGGNQLGHDQALRHVPRHDGADHADGDSVQVRLAEHTLATLHPREIAGGGQRQMDHRRGPAGLTQPTEAAGGPHLRGDQVGHLIDVTPIDRGKFFDLAYPVLRCQPRPGAVVEGVAGRGDGGLDIVRTGAGNLRDRLLGMRGNDGKSLRLWTVRANGRR